MNEHLISVILPTLWIPDYVETTILNLIEHDTVGQIIIIDNNGTSSKKNINHEKITYIKESHNTYVNPAWNKAVKYASYDKLMFLNDDIYTDWKLIDLVAPHITSNIGMIGLGNKVMEPGLKLRPIEELVENFKLIPSTKRVKGYACLFFMHKSNYRNIPDGLKIFYGDDFLYSVTKKDNFQITNWPIEGALSTSIKKLEVGFILKQDEKFWKANKNFFFK